MRSTVAATVAAAALVLLVRALALPLAATAAPAGDPVAGGASSTAGASSVTSPSSAKPTKARPGNAIDRTSSDPGAATFKSFDSNGDGYVSRDEARESAELSRRFDALDRNRDGRLSPGEVTGWRNVSYRPTSKHATAPIPGEDPGNIPPTAAPKR